MRVTKGVANSGRPIATVTEFAATVTITFLFLFRPKYSMVLEKCSADAMAISIRLLHVGLCCIAI